MILIPVMVKIGVIYFILRKKTLPTLRKRYLGKGASIYYTRVFWVGRGVENDPQISDVTVKSRRTW